MGNEGIEPLDFEANEQSINRANLEDVEDEVKNRSKRLATRITHFATQFGIPEEEFWTALSENPKGPLAAALAKEARRQNIHEQAAAKFLSKLPLVSDFEKLPSQGPNALYVTSDGQIVSGADLGEAPRPSKSIDFRWKTCGVTCYAAQKYTKASGGNQDNQFLELETLLSNFQPRRNNDTALFILVDGPYYTEAKLKQLYGLVRLQSPYSYVSGVNDLLPILEGMKAAADDITHA